jgi:cytochrome c oxidase assembly factor CtaG
VTVSGTLVFGGDLHLGEALPPVALAVMFLVAYQLRAGRLARQDRPVAAWRRALYAAGVVLVAVVQLPPFDAVADQVLVAHMTQHMLLGSVASLMIVAGLTGPILAPVLRVLPRRGTRWLTHPLVALILWAVDMYGWRFPPVFQAAIRHDLLHALEHACFVGFGVLLWAALLGPMPKPAWFLTWPRLTFVIAARVLGAVLAYLFIWAQTDFYPYYRSGEALAGLTPSADQTAAGGVMMLVQVVLTVSLLAWLFLKLMAQEEQRQRTVDLAHERGVPLEDARAARAAAAGTSDRLRERIAHADHSEAALLADSEVDAHHTASGPPIERTPTR